MGRRPVEYTEGSGINFSDLESAKRDTEIPHALTGGKVVEIVSNNFDELPVKLRNHLVESNVVLTLAGLKPQSEFFIDIDTEEESKILANQINQLNAKFNETNPEISFLLVGDPFVSGSHKDPTPLTQMISVKNLIGAERISKISKIPGMIPFEASSGWQGAEIWWHKVVANVEKLQRDNQLPQGEHVSQNVLSGWMKGYPDQAILDFTDFDNTGRKKKLQDSNIPCVGIYREAQPNYDFYPEHANDPQIRENIEQAGRILKEFYESDWHRKIASEPGLLEKNY